MFFVVILDAAAWFSALKGSGRICKKHTRPLTLDRFPKPRFVGIYDFVRLNGHIWRLYRAVATPTNGHIVSLPFWPQHLYPQTCEHSI